MSEYQVLARKYRPALFSEVLGQEAIVTTLKNAIKHNRLAHAYLFCGMRGTGKTTLARLFAKALNCLQPTSDLEPCNACSFCKEITSGYSLDVIEIDGASNRGIDDIRQINETVGYAASSGKYKIYIIDEVHMLTKEAFNALLKTLEEPPPKVIFIFATTEPHKVLPTILSRCQRFNLNRIPLETIVKKLTRIVKELGVDAEEEALRIIAHRAEGGMRDAESLLDQIHSFHEGKITTQTTASVLGVMTRDCFFELDKAGADGNLAAAFEVSHRLFSEGKDLIHFVEGLTEHFRNILLVKLAGKDASFLSLTEAERNRYEASAKLYRKELCMDLIEYLTEKQNSLRYAPSSQIALEAILLHVLRSHHRIPIEFLIRRLSELESDSPTAPAAVKKEPTPVVKKELAPVVKKEPPPAVKKEPAPAPATEPVRVSAKDKSQHDTLLNFAAVELEGRIQKK
jgi:DNA polymerase-3 subunit gamma/tau